MHILESEIDKCANNDTHKKSINVCSVQNYFSFKLQVLQTDQRCQLFIVAYRLLMAPNEIPS